MSRILVIDDDDGIRANVLDLLEAEGFTGFGAADGNAGVALAMEQLPDLIVCDVTMQGLDGFEVFEILNLDPRTAVIPFVFLSARAERADIRRGMALGADDYLTKPFTRVELLGTIRARLERKRPVVTGFEHLTEEPGDVERPEPGKQPVVPAALDHVHGQPRRIGQLQMEDLVAGDHPDAGRVVAPREHVEAVQAQAERGMTGAPHDPPRVRKSVHEATPSQGLVRDP